MSFWSDIVRDVGVFIQGAAGGGPGIITSGGAGVTTPQQLATEVPGIHVAEAIWTQLTNAKMWKSLGWLLLGIVLMLAGVLLWIGPSAARRSPIGMAADAGRAAAT